MDKKEIIFMDPVFTHNIWGGTRLRDEFGYSVSGNDVGECWGIAAHPHGDCRVKSGFYKGKRLSQLWKEEPGLFGCPDMEAFPLLVKIIDAREDLSIQVHPDDQYAQKHENSPNGKTECWYILSCQKDAKLIIGHNAQTREKLADMIEKGQWNELIQEVPIRKGDFIQINPGTVHAIKGGVTLLETQQNCDITYRLYDYNRLDGGKLRELHTEKSKDVITVPAESVKSNMRHTQKVPINRLYKLYEGDFYKIFQLKLKGCMAFQQDYPFLLVSIIEGKGILNGQKIDKGDHFILPYGYGEAVMEGKLQAICSTI